MSRKRSSQLVDVVACHMRHDATESYWIAVLDDVAGTGAPPMMAHTQTLLQMYCPCMRCGAFVDMFEDHLDCAPGEEHLENRVVLRVHESFVEEIRQAADRQFTRAKSRTTHATRRTQITEAGLKHTRAEVRALHALQGGQCFYCLTVLFSDAQGTNVAEDHFVPLARGGHDGITNIVLACRPCNNSKLAKDGFGFMWAAEDAASDEVRDQLMEMHRRHRQAYPELWSAARGRRRPRRRATGSSRQQSPVGRSLG